MLHLIDLFIYGKVPIESSRRSLALALYLIDLSIYRKEC